MKILYYDCFSGISGDMNLASLIDLGVDSEYLLSELKKLNLDGYEIKISKDSKHGIFGTRVDVELTNEIHDHSHDHHPGNHHHIHESTLHVQQHKHDHHHEQRGIKKIEQIINNSKLHEKVKQISLKIFEKVAVAEAKIHNKKVDEIHFHEVGAVDSIVDIVGAAICIDYLKPDKIMASSIQLGGGFVKCAHGTFPVPAPATVEILKGIPVKSGAVQFETTTPTGAAILAALVDEFTDKPGFTIEKTAYGIGHKNADIPNVLRVHLANDSRADISSEKMMIIECNIDDMNPETYDYIMESLLKKGAKDVFLDNIIMKKSRPAIKLSVICSLQMLDEAMDFILKETSTLGVRYYEINRKILERTLKTIATSLGKVTVKYSGSKGKITKAKPEYDDCVRISKEKNLPLLEVMKIIQKEIDNK